MIKPTHKALQPMYAMLAHQFFDDYDLMEAVVCDLGCGEGYLGIELAKITNAKIIFLDIDPNAIAEAKKNFEAIEADNEVEFIVCPAEKMDLPDESVDFIMSRGSIFFWDDIKQGINEAKRILKPGGIAVIGGGLGRYIPDTMRKRMWDGIEEAKRKLGIKKPACKDFPALIKLAMAKNTRLFDDGKVKGGKWLEITKV